MRTASSWQEHMVRFGWALALLSVPVTSFAHYPSIFGQTSAQPLAFIPLIAIAPLLAYITYKQKQMTWIVPLIPLGMFLMWALLGAGLGLLRPPWEFEGVSISGRIFRAWASLGIGLVFLVIPVLLMSRGQNMQKSLRWLYLGLTVMLIWNAFQVSANFLGWPSLGRLGDLQKIFSVRGLVRGRISGMAYEPSWLAFQLVAVYLPFLVSAWLTGERAFLAFKWLEPALALLSVGALLLTYSRSGLGTFAACLIVVVLVKGFLWLHGHSKTRPLNVLRSSEIFVVAILFLAASGWLLAQNDYFASLWQFNLDKGIVDYIVNIKGGARLAYAWAGLRVFAAHPWVGVGWGQSGFYLYDALPDWALAGIPEIAHRLGDFSAVYPNTKNLYVRLLAETGWVGFSLWIGFLVSVLRRLIKMVTLSGKQTRFVALAGIWVWVAVVMRSFSQDSLALPDMWLGLAIVLGYSARHTFEGG